MRDASEAAGDKHIAALDGVRGLAILSVMLFHFAHPFVATSIASGVVLRAAGAGWLGVELFFVLSGFLITRILVRHKGGPGAMRRFYARRVLRIFPLYYAYLTFVFVVGARFVTPAVAAWLDREQAWFWLYGPNVLQQVASEPLPYVVNATWSLGVEEQFYLLWPWVVLLSTRRQLASLCIGSALVMLVTGLARGIVGGPLEASVLVRLVSQRGFNTLVLGALLAIALEDRALAARLVAVARRAFPFLAVGALAYGASLGASVPFVVAAVGYQVFVAWICALVILAAGAPASNPVVRVIGTPFLRDLGKYSYGLYLIHVAVDVFLGQSRRVGLLTFALRLESPLLGYALYAGAMFTASYLLARASWHFFESPILSLKRYFEYEQAGRAERRAPVAGGEQA
jgi:peptidoglycan/LPS O-acetylase OafA/YrhL